MYIEAKHEYDDYNTFVFSALLLMMSFFWCLQGASTRWFSRILANTTYPAFLRHQGSEAITCTFF